MNIIKYKYIFLGLSAILVIVSVLLVAFLGLHQGIDFVGGTIWEIKGVSDQLLEKFLPKNAIVTNSDKKTFVIRLSEISETDHQEYLQILRKENPDFEELRFESIGSSIGLELRQRAIWAFLLVLLGISLYIAFAFRKVSRPVSSWKYGVITLLTLFHDAIIPAGLMAYLGWIGNVEVGVNFIVAVLVVIGFSVHDTIVVFDRVRENLRLEKNVDFNFPDLVNRSVLQTITRSINTSLTLILVLLALYFVGAGSLDYFSLIILVGVIFGTYSSIFVASPLLVLWRGK